MPHTNILQNIIFVKFQFQIKPLYNYGFFFQSFILRFFLIKIRKKGQWKCAYTIFIFLN